MKSIHIEQTGERRIGVIIHEPLHDDIAFTYGNEERPYIQDADNGNIQVIFPDNDDPIHSILLTSVRNISFGGAYLQEKADFDLKMESVYGGPQGVVKGLTQDVEIVGGDFTYTLGFVNGLLQTVNQGPI